MKYLLIGLALFVTMGCTAQRNDNPEFFVSTQKKRLTVIAEAAGFQPGDTIVDIGSGNGWFDAAFGIGRDSLTFFLEELDSTHIRDGSLQSALTAYEHSSGKPSRCSFIQVVGTDKSTLLPDSFCQTILLLDTYHHVKHRNEMIQDMRRILKKDGKVVVYEPLARKPNDVLKACQSVLSTQQQIIATFERNGFHLDKIYKSVNNNRKKVRVFTFVTRGQSQ